VAIGTAITGSAARAIITTAVTGITAAGDRPEGHLKGRRRETAAFFMPEAVSERTRSKSIARSRPRGFMAQGAPRGAGFSGLRS